MKGLIVIPVYNEAQSLAKLQLCLKCRDSTCHVLFVNDGSRDGSRELLDQTAADVVHHPTNLGYLEALRTGLAVALEDSFDFVVFFDGDGQHRIEDLNTLVAFHRHNPQADVVIGSRYLSGQRAASFLRHVVSQFYAFLVRWLVGYPIHDVTSGLKLLNRRAMAAMNSAVLEDGHAEFLVFMAKAGCRIHELPIQVEERKHGVSMYHLPKMLLYPIRTSFLILIAFLSKRALPKLSQ